MSCMFVTCLRLHGEVRLSLQDAVHQSGAVSIGGIVCIGRRYLHHRRACQTQKLDSNPKINKYIFAWRARPSTRSKETARLHLSVCMLPLAHHCYAARLRCSVVTKKWKHLDAKQRGRDNGDLKPYFKILIWNLNPDLKPSPEALNFVWKPSHGLKLSTGLKPDF